MKKHIDGPEISAFLDDALAAERRKRVTAHLASCSDCRRELESLRHLKRTLSAAPRKTMPADLALALEHRLVGRAPWTSLRRPAFWIPAGATVAAALALGLWTRAARSSDEVPIEPLLAAHARYSAEALIPEENLVASTYSDQLSTLYADVSDIELE